MIRVLLDYYNNNGHYEDNMLDVKYFYTMDEVDSFLLMVELITNGYEGVMVEISKFDNVQYVEIVF